MRTYLLVFPEQVKKGGGTMYSAIVFTNYTIPN